MEKYHRLFTSESVTEGHPDKVCDQISDAILDAILEKDPQAHVACEATVTTGLVTIMGEIKTNCYVDVANIARSTIQEIGYQNRRTGFDGLTCGVINTIKEQSCDIDRGVENSWECRQKITCDLLDTLGAGDQGMMFGFACRETEELMPLPISLAHQLAKKLTEVRKNNTLPYLLPDGKTQVTVEYDGNTPVRVDTIVISAQHDEGVEMNQLSEDIKKWVIQPVIPSTMLDQQTKYYINPSGHFVIGGPEADSGLTGRKIIVDTYGGYSRHGGGSFSGKDPTKVDRTATYAARYVAKNVVAAGLAERCEIQVAYAIGVARPVSVFIDTFGTGILPDEEIAKKVLAVFDFRPAAIIQQFDLLRPIFKQTAAYGHFGRKDLDLPWEKTDLADKLKSA
ncbi:methionine adenosyltransferase [bacterium]|nr:methionine adenosyltransferase [bacterium]